MNQEKFQSNIEKIMKSNDSSKASFHTEMQSNLEEFIKSQMLNELNKKIDSLARELDNLKRGLNLTSIPSFIQNLKGKDGVSPNIEDIIKKVIPFIPPPKDGYIPKKGKDYRDGKDGSPDTPNQIIDKIHISKKKIEMQKIEGLKDELDLLKNRPTQVFGGGGGGGGDTIRYVDLSSQCDGQTKTFTLTRVNRVLGVHGTSAPAGVYRPDVDWTYSTASGILTLTSEVIAPASGQTLWVMYVES